MQNLPEQNAARIRLAAVLTLLLLFGCREKEENTATSGNVTVLSSESIASLIQTEAAEFHRIYPAAAVDVLPVPTREAIVQLLNDSVHAVAVDRPLNEEEQYVVRSANLNVTENVIGSDAVVVLVHRSNPLRSLSMATMREVLSGSINRWEKVPGSGKRGPLHLVLTGRNSGLYEILATNYGDSKNPPKPSVLAGTQDEILRAIERDELSMGMILFSAYDLHRKSNRSIDLRALSVALPDTTVQPTQQTIYLKLYPLSLPLYYYTTERRSLTASGFATFMKSLDGQKLIQNAGIVPATIPSRTIQLTEEQQP